MLLKFVINALIGISLHICQSNGSDGPSARNIRHSSIVQQLVGQFESTVYSGVVPQVVGQFLVIE